MTLNSLDVQNKTFNTKMRGFDKREVDEFLDLVVRDYDEFAQTMKDQERELKALRERVKYFDDMKDSLNKSIVVAQEAADNLRAQAKSEAETTKLNSEKEASDMISTAGQKSQLIIEAAKKEAGFILNAASEDARKLVRDTDDLKRKMRLYHQRMTSIIENQLASIQSDDWAEIFRPTEDPVVNPEEKLQEIITIHLGEAEDTLAKTQAIRPLTEADLLKSDEEKSAEAATDDVKDETKEENVETEATEETPSSESSVEEPASEEKAESENASEQATDQEAKESESESEASEESEEAQPAEPEHEIFPEIESDAPKAEENIIDNQETIDLSEVINHDFKGNTEHE